MRSRCLGVAVMAVLAIALPASASAATIAPTTTQDANDAAAPCSLREAILSANGDSDVVGCTHTGTYTAGGTDVIQLAGPDYELTSYLDVSTTSGPLTIQGLGAGSTGIDGNGNSVAVILKNGPPTSFPLTLSGLTAHDTSGHVIAAGGPLSLNSVVVRDGHTTGDGGGILANNNVTLTNSTVSGNSAMGDGGGISTGGLTLTNSTVSGNSASAGAGGGIKAVDATVTGSTVRNNSSSGDGGGIAADNFIGLTDSTVEGNDGAAGGGVLAGANATLTRSNVTDNSASAAGGGISSSGIAILDRSNVTGNSAGATGGGINAATTVTLTDSRITDNKGTGNGGGVFGKDLSLSRSSVLRNHSGDSGGGLATLTGSVGLSQSTIAANQADVDGGGVFQNGASTTIVNSTVSGNAAKNHGGGLSLFGISAALRNATITDNTADADNSGTGNGGGFDNATTATMANTILAANRDLGGEAPDCDAAVSSQDYNLIGTNTGCTGLTNAGHDQIGSPGPIDPMLRPLGANGGSTLTHGLLSGSTAINMGYPGSGSGTACEATDQRGVPRSLGGRCDIGAYETARPDARISSASVSHRRHRATFRFSSHVPFATFLCRIDNKSYASCRSPKAYHLRAGKHTFRVVARDVDGTSSTAVRTVRI